MATKSATQCVATHLKMDVADVQAGKWQPSNLFPAVFVIDGSTYCCPSKGSPRLSDPWMLVGEVHGRQVYATYKDDDKPC